MCANAFRTEVRPVLSFSVSQQWEHQPQYGKLERRAHYSGWVMRTMELQVIHTHTHTCTQAGLWECVKQRKTPAEYYQRYALLMVMLCEVQSCSTPTPAAAALYSNGTARYQHAVSRFLLDSASHSFCPSFVSVVFSSKVSWHITLLLCFPPLFTFLLCLSCAPCTCDCLAWSCSLSQQNLSAFYLWNVLATWNISFHIDVTFTWKCLNGISQTMCIYSKTHICQCLHYCVRIHIPVSGCLVASNFFRKCNRGKKRRTAYMSAWVLCTWECVCVCVLVLMMVAVAGSGMCGMEWKQDGGMLPQNDVCD